MITITDLHRRALRHYFDWLRDIASGNPDFKPLIIKRTGDDRTTGEERLRNLDQLAANSKKEKGHGYRIELDVPGPRSATQQSRIGAILFDGPEDLLAFTEKEQEHEAFRQSLALILEKAPYLQKWCVENVREICRFSEKWPSLLAVVNFMRASPQPNLPLRLLPIEEIDTKFIEQHNTILCSLIDVSIESAFINTPHRLFSKRYGLPEQAPFVECYFNAANLIEYFHGFSAMAFPGDQLAQNPLPLKKVFVVENRTSVRQLLHYPLPDSMVIFGGGFGVALLKDILWLKETTLYYWGDMDAHGLAILSQFRSYFPHVHPLLMDQAAWEKHQHLSTPGKPFKGNLPQHLNASEQQLFRMLQETNQRMEQERIPQKSLHQTLVNEQVLDNE